MVPGPQQPVTAVVFNDLHNGTNAFQSLLRVVGDTPFDFTIFNGDCLADPAAEAPMRKALAAYTEGAQANLRPTFFLRGNHETRGSFARDLPRWLTWPGGRPYFAFTAGPVRWVVLDCGEDKPDKHPVYAGLVDFEGFRREETAWLKAELASAAFREARWRVLVHHIPLYENGKDGSYSPFGAELWAKLPGMELVDLALNGHTHTAAFNPTNSLGNPYPIAVGGGPLPSGATVMILEADQSRLKLRMLNVKGEEAFPAFEQQR
jgi:3',5'-cyclic AMP phosphodiesterase CpdA